MPIALAYVVAKPIHYQAPLLRRIAAEEEIRLTVFFRSDVSVRRHLDPEFGVTVDWGKDLLNGYDYEFLPSVGSRTERSVWLPLSHGLLPRLKRGRFDAVWVHGYAVPYNAALLYRCKRLGLRTLVRDEATLLGTSGGKVRQALKRSLLTFLERQCDGFLAIGTQNRAFYRSFGVPDAKIFSMPYAVDNHAIRVSARNARERREELRLELGLAAGRPVVLFAAKLVARKRPLDLLEAVLRVAADPRARDPYLLFAGDGSERELLEARAVTEGDRVRFLGFRSQAELPALYDLADLFVLPSIKEPWGMVVNEAMNAGTAILASDQVGCAADLVFPGENGATFPARNVSALAECLVELLSDERSLYQMGQRSRELVKRVSLEADVAGLRAALGIRE